MINMNISFYWDHGLDFLDVNAECRIVVDATQTSTVV